MEQARDEVKMIIRGQLHDGTKLDIDIMTCTEAAFVVCLVRDCLAHHKVPIVYSRYWKEFAGKYSRYVMST